MTSPTKFENYFRVFRDILRSIYHSISLQEVFNIVVTKTAEVLNAKGALLRILNQQTGQFDIGAAYGLGERYVTKLCIKGWNLNEHVNSFMRLKKPMVKTYGRFINAEWDEAIELTADRFRDIIGKYGPDSAGVLVSAKMTNEENYLAQEFARAVIGTNNVDHCARL